MPGIGADVSVEWEWNAEEDDFVKESMFFMTFETW